MRRKPLGNSVPTAINRYINSAYDNVLKVAENIEFVNAVAENIEYINSYLGAYEEAPTTRPDGSPLETGDVYYDDKATYYYEASDDTWIEFNPEELITAATNAVEAAAIAEEAKDIAVDAADKAFSLVGGTDVGDYEDDSTINVINDYVVFSRGTPDISLWKAEESVNLPYTVNSTLYSHPSDDPNLRAYTSTANLYTYEETTYLTDGQLLVEAQSELTDFVVYIWDAASGERHKLDVVYDYTTTESNQIQLQDTYPVGSIVTIVFEDIGQSSDTYLKKIEAEQKYGDHTKLANRGTANSHPASAISTTNGSTVQQALDTMDVRYRIGNISDYVGDNLTESEKSNSYQYPDDSDYWYGVKEGETFPVTIPTDPSSDDKWAVVSAVTTKQSIGLHRLQSKSVSDLIQGITNGGEVVPLEIGQRWAVDDYYGGANPNNSGVLFFKVVPAGTGTDDGGKYIDIPSLPLQLEQNLKKPYDVKAWGARGDGVTDDSTPVQNASNLTQTTPVKDVIFQDGVYLINEIDPPVGINWMANQQSSDEFSDSPVTLKYNGQQGGSLLTKSSQISRLGLFGLKFDGNLGAGKFLPTGGFGDVSDLADCQFLGCSWNNFIDVFDSISVTRCTVDRYYINNCYTSSFPWHWKGADSTIGSGFFGNNETISTPSAMLFLEACSYMWIKQPYISGYGASNDLRITGGKHLYFNEPIFDISRNGAVYISASSGVIIFDTPKFGYNNLDVSNFVDGIFSGFGAKNVTLLNPQFDSQTKNPNGSDRVSVQGKRYKFDSACSNISIINTQNDPDYTNPDEIDPASDVLIADYRDFVPSGSSSTVSNEPTTIFTQETRGILKVDCNYIATEPKQMNLVVSGTIDGSRVVIKNSTGQNIQMANFGAGVFDTLGDGSQREYAKIDGLFEVL